MVKPPLRDRLLLAGPGSTKGKVEATDLSVRASLVALEASFERFMLTFPPPLPVQARLRVSTVSLQGNSRIQINNKEKHWKI